MTVDDTALHATGIVKRYRRHTVLDGVDLEVRRGEAVALTGENGSGKSTLLRICARVLRPDAGAVRVSGRVGFCPQEPALFDLLTADEHLALFGAAAGLSRDEALRKGHRRLDSLGFHARPGTVVRDLSGGTRQKLNLAVALLAEPDVLLLDEPYQGFDHGTYVDFWDLVAQWRGADRAVVVVTHMLTELWRTDRVVNLKEDT
jgi:ABC-type multidrug transport system ATPase subunit